jgi:G3E family GTPase
MLYMLAALHSSFHLLLHSSSCCLLLHHTLLSLPAAAAAVAAAAEHHHEHHRHEEVCGTKTFTEVEDRPIVKERVERILEHQPVEKQVRQILARCELLLKPAACWYDVNVQMHMCHLH